MQAIRETEITRHDVERIIEHFDCFEQLPDRPAVNPFTKEALVFPGEGKAKYMKGVEVRGDFSLEDGRILFSGVPEVVAKEVAMMIAATILPWDSS